MNVSGKLIIQGKAWGEFENAKRSKGNIEISGYRSYGGTHTVRMVDQPQLNENQQIVLSWLKIKHFDSYFKAAVSDLFFYVRHDDIEGFPNLNYRKLVEGYKQLSDKEFAQVLEVFSRWAQEREEG
ncbi:MAG TPA: hypothetical protein DEQ24_01295 [Enterococcus sp.]|nr:hypothetical protein [Enterococcus sp.]